MKAIIAGAAGILLCFGITACTPTVETTSSTAGTTSLAAEAGTLASNIYTAFCVGSNGNPPLTAAVATLTSGGTLNLNANQSALIEAIQADCAFGAPTTAYAAGLWTATLYATVERQFPQVRLKL